MKSSLFIGFLLSLVLGGYAQTSEDLRLGYQELVCVNDTTGQGRTITVSNLCREDARFAGGGFSIEWGDSKSSDFGEQEDLSHIYEFFRDYTLKLKWKHTDGRELEKDFPMSLKRIPRATFSIPSAGSCINTETIFQIVGYEQEYAETKYRFSYNGKLLQEITQAEANAANGVVRQRFTEKMCDAPIKLTQINECIEKGEFTEESTATLKPITVMAPIRIDFDIDPQPACTGLPFEVNVDNSKVSVCNMRVDYLWKFEEKGGFLGLKPEVPPYDEPGKYSVQLVARVNNYTCANDTTTKLLTVIRRVKADFEIDKDTLCFAGTPIDFQAVNKSSGDEIIQNVWSVNGRVEQATEELKNFSTTFNRQGDMVLKLTVNNSCSEDEKDTVIVVKQSPEFLYFKLKEKDTICSQAGSVKLNMADYINYDWHGNPQRAHWTITPATGVSYEPGYGAESAFPIFMLQPGQTYELTVQLDAAKVDGVECGDPAKRVLKRSVRVSDPTIVSNIVLQPEATDGMIRICEKEIVTFQNNSTGEGLKYEWSVVPDPSKTYHPSWTFDFTTGDASSASPTMRFNGYGEFIVTVKMNVFCNEKTETFRVHVGKAPTITYFDMGKDSLLCSGIVISPEEMRMKVIYAWYNNEPQATWECSPGVEISDKNVLYPEFRFPKVGIYKLKVSLAERGCSANNTVSEREVTVRVRSSDLESDLSIDKSDFCEQEPVVITNIGTDSEGDCMYSWMINKEGGSSTVFDPNKSPVLLLSDLEYGTYQVIGEIIGYCDTLKKELQFVVHKNPEVILKDSASCPGVITLATAESYRWWNNTPRVAWEIKRADGADEPGDVEMAADALTQLYPEVGFKRPGKYLVKATLPHAGCPADDPVVEKEFWIYDPAIYGEVSLKQPIVGDPLKADVCENETVEFLNTMTEEAGKLSWEWTVESEVAEGYEYVDGDMAIEESVGRVKKAPAIRFLKYGEYKVKVKTFSTCNIPVEKEFHVTVRGIPEIEFSEKMKRVCAGDGQAVDMAKYVTYKDRKNAVITPEWTITPETGFTWEPGYGADSDTPRILFHENAHYVIRLAAKSKCAAGGELVLSSEIDVIYASVQSIFSVGMDSVGCVNDPAPYEISLTNTSVQDSLKYTWTVLPESGWEWIEGDGEAESPRMKISEEGDYTIRLFVTNGCQEDDSVFTVKAFGRPTVSINDIADECEKFRFSAANRVSVDLHNDTIKSAVWTIESNPGYVSEGYEFVKGTTADSFYPEIDFRTCDYTVKVQYYNRCVTPGEASFQVKVDKFVPIEPLNDDAICELTDARELEALPAGGYWTLGDPALPNGDKILQQREGKFYFNPAFGTYEEKDIKLVYNFRNLTCVAHDTMNMHVWPLPYVEAGDSLEMCLNHDPMPLVGLDSARQATWEVNRGAWILGVDTLKENLFATVTPGGFKLLYEYTDHNTCRHVDSTFMTVHALPKTGFAVNEKNCIHQPVLFAPEQPESNTFEWMFGDNTTGFSEDTITHRYTDYGYRTVVCRAENNYGCRDTSDDVRIEIVNLPPAAFFDVDTLYGCAPFEVDISINRDDYVSDHNYLSFHWDYGEETQTDSLGPIVPKFYPSGAWDTTYLTAFTVSNMCGSSTYDTTITVYSVPKVSFALMHQWECSPVFLELQNTTTGNNCRFDWTFTNKRTGEIVGEYTERNPSHEFVTDSKATTFYIALKAQNVCNEDRFTDSLVVKPRQISAHFTPLEDAYACVNEEILFRNNSSDTSAVILNTYWNFGDGEKSQEWSPRHAYAVEGTYTVSLKIDNGCGWDTITSPVQIMSLPKLTATIPDELCEKDTAILMLAADRELSYVEWDFGDGKKGFRDSLQYIYQENGVFKVTVKGIAADFGQCVDSVTKEITIHGLPEMTILPLDTLHCSPLLYVPQVTGDALLMWDYGDDSGLTTAPEHQYENPTDSILHFRAIAYAETDKGCKNSYERFVKVINLPRAKLDRVVEKGNPQKVTFINLSEEYTDCIWELPIRGTIHSLENQVEEFRENGTYAVTLMAKNYHGCQDSTTLEYEVLIKGLYFPNTFIPHSLNPKISRFNGIGIGLVSYRLEIFDQYNNKIWETKALENGKPSEGWDGCNTKGERMPQGVYIWRAEAIFGDDEVWTGENNESGVPQTTQGTVMLVRE